MSIPLPNSTLYPQPLNLSLNNPPPSPPSSTFLPPSHYTVMSSQSIFSDNDDTNDGQEKMDQASDWRTAGPGGRGGRSRLREENETAAKRVKVSKLDDPAPRGLQREQARHFDRRHVGSGGDANPDALPVNQEQVQCKNEGPNEPILITRSIVILQPTDKDKGFRTSDPFKLKREVLAICNATTVRFLRFGGIAITVESEEEASKLKAVTLIGGIPVKAAAPRSERFCRGVINNVVPGLLCDNIKAELEAENAGIKVVGVKRLGKETSNTYCIEFEGKSLPSQVYIGFWRHKVRVYYEAVVQCYKCQKWNHISSACRGPERCLHCSGAHRHTQCPAARRALAPKCCNCGGQHPSFSSQCPAKRVQMQIYKLKTVENISYPAARARIVSKNKSFADILSGRGSGSARPPPPPIPRAQPAIQPLRRPPPPPSVVDVSSQQASGSTQSAAPVATITPLMLKSFIKLVSDLTNCCSENPESLMDDVKMAAQRMGVAISHEEVAQIIYPENGE